MPTHAPLFRYVALGDSSGAGVGADLDGGYPERIFRRIKASGVNVGILNLARSGATTREVLQHQVSKAVSTRPSLVTLGAGTNDLWRMVPMATFQVNLDQIARQLESSGAEVVVSNLIDLSLAPVGAMVETFLKVPRAMFIRRVEEMNEQIAALSKRPRFHVVDLFQASRGEIPHRQDFFSSDGFHPSAAGYDRWAEMMWPTVERVVQARLEGRGEKSGS